MNNKKKFLMCSPDNFRVIYEINPWMSGQIGKVHINKAYEQWYNFYLDLSKYADIQLIESTPDVPDMVFTANAGTVYNHNYISGNMLNKERQSETAKFISWFQRHAYKIQNEFPIGIFEGSGDMFIDELNKTIWCGFGQRSEADTITKIIDTYFPKEWTLHLIKLSNPNFYHLDTCMCLIGDKLGLVYTDAFEQDIVDYFTEDYNREWIFISEESAKKFLCNSVVIDKEIFMPYVSSGIRKVLEDKGFNIHVHDMSEFIKAGGAMRCLTLEI